MTQSLPPDIKLVIFDLDGTLVDAYPAIKDSLNHMLKQMGRKPVSLKTVVRSVGWGVDNLVSRFIELERTAEALAIFRAHHDQRLQKKIKLLPGALKLLRRLHKNGYVLAIASNRPEKFCRIILKTLKIDRYFTYVLGGDSVRRPKPYGDILLRILKSSGVRREKAIYVGDMSVDVLCGRQAKVFTVAVPTGSCTLKEIREARPDLFIKGLPALLKMI